MTITFTKQFKKALKKLPSRRQDKFFKTLVTFQTNEFDPQLRNHGLVGEFKNVRSIDVTGDIRAQYIRDEDTITFIGIGTHAQLYK